MGQPTLLRVTSRRAAHGDDDLEGLETSTLLDDLLRGEGVVEESACPQDHGDNVIPGNIIDLLLPFFGGIGQKAQQDDKTHKGSEADLLQEGREQGDPDAEKGKSDQDRLDDNGRHALPYPDIGFTVIFAHDLFQVFIFDFVIFDFFFTLCA